MANVIRFKRRTSGAIGAPTSLKNAEVAFNEVDQKLYYGKGDDGSGNATSIITIAGVGWDAGSNLSSYGALAGNNTWTGTNTFSAVSTIDIAGGWKIDGTSVLTSAAELNVLDLVTPGTAAASKALVVDSSKNINLGTGGLTSATVTTSGNGTVGGNLIVTGNLTVNGTTQTINSTTVQVSDKNLELGVVASPTDVTANGGGITLKGATDKTLNWVSSTTSWTASENFDLATGKTYKINGTNVLTATALGSAVVGSSLTSVGTIATGVWQGTAVAVGYGGLGLTAAVTGLLKGNGTSYAAAVVDTDYLGPNSTLDGGTY